MSDIITPVTDISQVWGMPAAEQAELLGHFTNDELLEFQRLLKVRVLLSDRTIERCKTSLLAFVKQCWKELEPGAFIPNWHHELICEYLEYQFYHPLEYNKVLINVQPRVLKSMICSVFFPCWVWLHRPGERFLCLSYAGQLANNHNFYRRRLIQSDTYRQLSADRPIDLLLGKNRISEFQNTRGGEMISRGMDGAVTGVGGTWIMCLTYGNVILTNQGPIPIGKIVEERLDVQVATYNHDLETVQYVPIDRYEKNIDDRDLIEIDLGDGQVLECTCDHPIYVVGKGYIKAEDIQPGDEVLCP